MDNNNFEIGFEKSPVGGNVNTEKWDRFEPPKFSGNEFGVANETNEFYGESVAGSEDTGEEFDSGITDAAAIINYGLNAASMKYGVENVVQKLKSYDPAGSENPISDFYSYLGVETKSQERGLNEQQQALESEEAKFREGPNQPSQNKSVEGFLAGLRDMKELIAEVESVDPRYEELRQGAKATGKGVFEYAVSSLGTQNLTNLFSVLATQREKMDTAEQTISDFDERDSGDIDSGLKDNSDINQQVGEGGKMKEDQGIKEDKRDQDILNPEILEKEEDTINKIREESLNPNIVDPKDLEKMEKDAA